MKVTFRCRYKNLNLNIDPGKPQKATLGTGKITTVRPPSTIMFKEFVCITGDPWEIREIRAWKINHSEDGITEVKKKIR